MTGRVHSFQSLGTLDGPGLRYVVFLQGCPLHCGYCHNPDTWDVTGGEELSAGEVFARVQRYKSYFAKEGGLTVSGGEPLLQAPFVTELFTLCRQDGISTCLDTSGCVSNGATEKLLEVTDLCLLDIKMTNEEDYIRHTGAHLSQALHFLEKLNRRGLPTWIRQVIVPGINDTPASIEALNNLIAPFSCVQRVELLAFHKLCLSKYEELGRPFTFDKYPAATPELIESLSSLIRLPTKQ